MSHSQEIFSREDSVVLVHDTFAKFGKDIWA